MMPTLLFVIYSIHLAVFSYLGWRRRELVYGFLVTTFVLLLAAHALRTFSPTLQIGTVAASWPPRIASWIFAAAGLVLLVRRYLKRRAAR